MQKAVAPLRLVPQISMICGLIVLFIFPGALSGLASPLVFLAPFLLIFGLQALGVLRGRPHFSIDRQLLYWSILLFFWLFLGVIRGTFAASTAAAASASSAIVVILGQVALALLIAFLVGTAHRDNRTRLLANLTYWSAMIIALLQIGMRQVGVEHKSAAMYQQTYTLSSTFESVGISMLRWQAPLATGVNGGALFFMFAGIAAIILRKRYGTPALFVGLTASLFGLAAIDSKSAIVAVPAVVLVTAFLKNSPRLLSWGAILIPTVPLLVVAGANYAPPEILDLVRTRSAQFGLFTGRETIWLAVWNQYIPKIDVLALFLGEGYFGQVSSGLILSYRQLFVDFGNTTQELATLHNGYLQVFVDFGLVGLVLYLCAIKRAVYLMAANAMHDESGRDVWRVLLCFMLSLLFSAGTEAVLTPYVREGFSFFVWILVIVSLFCKVRVEAQGTVRTRKANVFGAFRPDAAEIRANDQTGFATKIT